MIEPKVIPLLQKHGPRSSGARVDAHGHITNPYIIDNRTLTIHLVAAVVLGIPLMLLYSVVSPKNVGFFLQDQNIAYPFLDHETVPTSICILIVVLGPFPIFLGLHLLVLRDRITKRQTQRFIITVFIKYFYLLAAVNLLTETIKNLTARKRPDFLGRCQPDFEGDIAFDTFVFVEDVCTNLDKRVVLQEGASSFPSGHASNLLFFSTFFALYLQKQLSYLGEQMKLAVGVFQIALLTFAIWVCETRWFNYVHHAVDIFFGAAIGASIAILGIYYLFSHESSFKQCMGLLTQMSETISSNEPSFQKDDDNREKWSLDVSNLEMDEFGTWVQHLIWTVHDQILFQSEGRSLHRSEATRNAYDQLYAYLRKFNKQM